MQRKLDYTEEAIEDLIALRRWLTQPGSGPAARKRLRDVRAAVNRLQQLPCLYPVGDHPGIRELPCAGGHRAIYEVNPDTGHNETAGNVRVLRVFGPGQDRDTLSY